MVECDSDSGSLDYMATGGHDWREECKELYEVGWRRLEALRAKGDESYEVWIEELMEVLLDLKLGVIEGDEQRSRGHLLELQLLLRETMDE